MMETKYYRAQDSTMADRAIDELFGGPLAGGIMTVIKALAGLIIEETPASLLERFSSGEAATPITGALLHLAVSAVYGAGFGLITALIPRQIREKIPGWLAGLAYAIVLAALAVNILLPGVRSPLIELPLWILHLGHAVYGVLLGRQAFRTCLKSQVLSSCG